MQYFWCDAVPLRRRSCCWPCCGIPCPPSATGLRPSISSGSRIGSHSQGRRFIRSCRSRSELHHCLPRKAQGSPFDLTGRFCVSLLRRSVSLQHLCAVPPARFCCTLDQRALALRYCASAIEERNGRAQRKCTMRDCGKGSCSCSRSCDLIRADMGLIQGLITQVGEGETLVQSRLFITDIALELAPETVRLSWV